MGKQIKKIAPPRPNKHEKICECCGNGGFTKKTVFKCKYCGWKNGSPENDELPENVEITRGPLEL